MSDNRINLVDATLALIDAAMETDPTHLGQLLEAEIADGWPGFPEALPHLRAMLEARPDAARWGTVLFLQDEPRVLVGMGGYKGPPSADGEVEIGYAIAPAYQNRGLATCAARALVARAFADGGVRAVTAHTLPEENPSVRVLQKLRFERVSADALSHGRTAWAFRLSRDDAAPGA